MRNLVFVVLCLLSGGCINHSIAFQDLSYSIPFPEKHDAGLTVVIDDELEREVRIKSAMTGMAHNWNARPVTMLKQVADIEFPQMFSNYGVGGSAAGGESIELSLSVPLYTFANMQATMSVRAVAKSADGNELFDRTYTDSGKTQGGKMFWGGAFAMKSAIRQSSLDALKAIFIELRADLRTHL